MRNTRKMESSEIVSITIAFISTAIFRWFVIPKLGLLPTDESSFFFHVAMIIMVILVAAVSFSLASYVLARQ